MISDILKSGFARSGTYENVATYTAFCIAAPAPMGEEGKGKNILAAPLGDDGKMGKNLLVAPAQQRWSRPTFRTTPQHDLALGCHAEPPSSLEILHDGIHIGYVLVCNTPGV